MNNKVIQEIARLSKRDAASIQSGMHLYDDLLLDSLDVTELVVFLEKEFHVEVAFNGLETVNDVIEASSGKTRFKSRNELYEQKTLPKWMGSRPPLQPPVGKTLGTAFLLSCQRMKQSLACTDPIETLSYTRLKSVAVGFTLIAKDLPGKEVGVLMAGSSEVYGLIFGLILAGKIPVMLNWSQGPYHIDQVLEQTKIQTILTTAKFIQELPMKLSSQAEEKIVLLNDLRKKLSIALREEGIQLARLSAEALIQHFKLDQMTGDETAVLLFTSGTEKAPKGVPLSHHNLLSNHRSIFEFMALTSTDALLGILPIFHVYGFSLTGIFPLLIGLKVVYQPSPLDFQGSIYWIHQWNVTTVATVPTFLHPLLRAPTAKQLTSLRRYVIGAEKAPPNLVSLIPSGIALIEGYGLTECSPVLSLRHVPNDLGVGKVLSGITCKIVDPETFKPLPTGDTGLICVRGPSVFQGYYNASMNPFVEIEGNRFFNTQDLGYLDPQGYLHLVGRASRTVKIGGEMISLAVIEEGLIQAFKKNHPTLQVAVMGESDAKKGSHLVLFTNCLLTLEEVNHALFAAGLSHLLKITLIEKIDSLPLTAMGKIDYKKIRLKREPLQP